MSNRSAVLVRALPRQKHRCKVACVPTPCHSAREQRIAFQVCCNFASAEAVAGVTSTFGHERRLPVALYSSLCHHPHKDQRCLADLARSGLVKGMVLCKRSGSAKPAPIRSARSSSSAVAHRLLVWPSPTRGFAFGRQPNISLQRTEKRLRHFSSAELRR